MFFSLDQFVREGDPCSEEEEKVFTEDPRVSDKEGCASQIGMMVLDSENADGLQICGFELLYLPWGQSGVDIRESGSGENESGPLECAPLSQWDPRVAKDMVMNMVVEESEFEATKVEH